MKDTQRRSCDILYLCRINLHGNQEKDMFSLKRREEFIVQCLARQFTTKAKQALVAQENSLWRLNMDLNQLVKGHD